MFDSTPPNLPIEPQTPVSATPPSAPIKAPMPVAPGLGMPPAVMVSSSKKEPEDIFADIDQGTGIHEEAPMAVETGRSGSSPLKWVAVVGISLVVLGGLGFAAWYFLIRVPASQEVTPVVVAEPLPVEQIEKPPVIEQLIVTEQPASSINVPPPVPIAPPPAQETAEDLNIQPIEGKDTDADGLTDVEEAVFGTNPAIKDTDGDGFSDGSEVSNLYSPKANARPLEAESDMQKITWKNWNFLIPSAWSIFEDPVFPDRLMITTAEAARFKLESETLPTGTTLEQWAPANFQPYKSFNTKNGLQVLQPQSSMNVYYTALGDSVLILTYDLNGDTSYEYRTSFTMLLNSLHE
ncbi:MAG: hypothetical protein ABIB04_01750 [Patescibacteria group bacterium]